MQALVLLHTPCEYPRHTMNSNSQTAFATPSTTPMKKGREASPPRQIRERTVRRRKHLTDTPATLVQETTEVSHATPVKAAQAEPGFSTPQATDTRMSRREALAANPLAPLRPTVRKAPYEN